MDEVNRIFELLKARGMQQKTFAEKVGVAPSKVSEWKNGRSKSYTDYWPKIAETLNTNVEYLLTGKTESSPPQKRDRLPDVWYELTDAQKAQAEEFMRFLRAARTESD